MEKRVDPEAKREVFDYNIDMRVVLTHEQADFDALASLLAASLIDDGWIPVLPRKMNRNVRAFITIYGAELPFVEPRDLPSGDIEEVCLVDTQGLVTLKGITRKTRVSVVDHHPKRKDLSDDWVTTIVPTGATVTIFTDAIRDRDGALNPIHATLLLLGIYEDTGSLTYVQTTPKDLNAAAYLLSSGASLQIARDYLNHPLSPQQQELYDLLRSEAQNLRIHGHTIVVASGDAVEMDEELSTIAHKMRDLLDPDALFLILKTKSGVQLIARSTSDQIDVSVVAAYFGGGGHDRASAALVRGRELVDVKKDLLDHLPDFVKPAITVRQIMSYGLQVLSPDTTVRDAAEQMLRFGHEGYPVVEDERVVGLLTRRAVDRALSHRLNLTAASLMNAGNVVVRSDDSIEHLQDIMTESGWGQIPVVNAEMDRVIGIVTRTDLLKILTGGLSQVDSMNLAAKLKSVLPAARYALLQKVSETAGEMNMPLYIVGGFVRDLILESPSLDYDLVVEGDAVELARRLVQKYEGRLNTHERFGTAKWHLDAVNIPNVNTNQLPPYLDLITARTEFYTYPTALPTVERGSIKLDLHRRDFTINTLAIRIDGRHYGQLLDHWGGMNDIRKKIVRVLHSLSFVDDPTRMLRAVRFEQRFGFRIDERTLELLLEAKPLMSRVTGDRVRHELDKIINEIDCNEMMESLERLGVLSAIHPALMWDDWHREKSLSLPSIPPINDWGRVLGRKSLTEQEWLKQRHFAWFCIWIIRFNKETIDSICNRLHFPRSETEIIKQGSELYEDKSELLLLRPSQIVERLDDFRPFAILVTFLVCDESGIRDILRQYLEEWIYVSPHINGNDLRERGLSPGPVYKDILLVLRSAWLDQEISTAKEELDLLDRLIEQARSGSKIL